MMHCSDALYEKPMTVLQVADALCVMTCLPAR